MTIQKILRRPAVEAITGLSRSTIYLKIDRREFPRPIPLGLRAVGWLSEEVEQWLQSRKIERDATNATKTRDHPLIVKGQP